MVSSLQSRMRLVHGPRNEKARDRSRAFRGHERTRELTEMGRRRDATTGAGDPPGLGTATTPHRGRERHASAIAPGILARQGGPSARECAMSKSRFVTDTAVTPLGDHRYAAAIDQGWWVIRGPNGGFLAALVLRAITTDVADAARRPRSFTVHYLRPPREGEIELIVQPERVGRTTTVVTARMLQDGKLTALAVAALGLDRPGPEFAHLHMPDAPGPDDLSPPPRPQNDIPLRDRFEMRVAIGRPPWNPESATQAVTGGWIRLAEPAPLDAH